MFEEQNKVKALTRFPFSCFLFSERSVTLSSTRFSPKPPMQACGKELPTLVIEVEEEKQWPRWHV
jgi:hypothetical protein